MTAVYLFIFFLFFATVLIAFDCRHLSALRPLEQSTVVADHQNPVICETLYRRCKVGFVSRVVQTKQSSIETEQSSLAVSAGWVYSAVGPFSRQQIRQREPLSHMTEVNVRAGKGEEKDEQSV